MSQMNRSPNYPSLTLPDAVADVKHLWIQKQRATMTAEEVAQAFGYKGLSGPSRTRLSALKKYGLLEERGSGWALSARAITLAVRDPSSDEYKTAIRNAVHDVDLFSRLLGAHADSSQRLLQQYLITSEKFTADGAKRAAEAFLAAKALVSGGDSGTLSETSEAESENEMVQNSPISSMPQPPLPSRGGLPLPVLMDDGTFQVVQIPRMSERAFSFFKAQLDTYKPAIVLPTPSHPEAESV